MDCDQCGRYRPTARILPVAGPAGTLSMACDPCRRRLSVPVPRPSPSRIGGPTRALAPSP